MPTYAYECQACDHAVEIFQSMSESPKRKCPACGRLKLKRKIGTGAGILFKGSGFYETDYRSQSYRDGAAAETKSSEKKGSEKKGSDSKGSSSDKNSSKASSGSKSEGDS